MILKLRKNAKTDCRVNLFFASAVHVESLFFLSLFLLIRSLQSFASRPPQLFLTFPSTTLISSPISLDSFRFLLIGTSAHSPFPHAHSSSLHPSQLPKTSTAHSTCDPKLSSRSSLPSLSSPISLQPTQNHAVIIQGWFTKPVHSVFLRLEVRPRNSPFQSTNLRNPPLPRRSLVTSQLTNRLTRR